MDIRFMCASTHTYSVCTRHCALCLKSLEHLNPLTAGPGPPVCGIATGSRNAGAQVVEPHAIDGVPIWNRIQITLRWRKNTRPITTIKIITPTWPRIFANASGSRWF